MSKIDMAQKDQIKRLACRLNEIADSERNIRNLKKWNDPHNWNRDLFRGNPRKLENGVIPFMVELDTVTIAEIVDVDLREYYKDSFVQLSKQLEYKDYRYKTFDDNFPYTREAYIWFGVATELGLFNTEIIYNKNKEPLVARPVINDEEDLKRMQIPDFYTSGSMPRIHRFYEEMNEMLEGTGIRPMFPSWVRGPFCIVTHLVGMENLLMHMLTDEEFVHKLMRYATDSIKAWEVERAKFTKTPPGPHRLYNDEVGCPTISPKLFEKFIMPYEIELSEFFGGVSYWHSCGNITDIIKYIKNIPNIHMFHVGPWTSLERACEFFDESTALDVCLKPEDDVYFASEADMEKKLKYIKDTGKNHPVGVRADVFQRLGDWNENMEKIQMWIKTAKRILS